MDLKLTRNAAYLKKLIYEGNAEQSVDIDITLPDYCPDILRILKCIILPQVTGYQASGDRLLIDGTVLLRVLYLDEAAKTVRAFENVSPFSKAVEIPSLSDSPSVSIKPKVDYINCRAVSPRRVDIHGAFTMLLRVTGRQKEDLVSEAEGEEIQVKCEKLKFSNLIGELQRQFVLSEVFDLGDALPPVNQLIRTEAMAMITEYKLITNKLLIKGELFIKALYSTDKDDGKLELCENVMPINQIIEMDGISEESEVIIRLDVLTLDLSIKEDSSGDMRLLECSARLCAVISATKALELSVVTDAYSLKYDVEASYRLITNERLTDTFKEKFLCKKTLDLSSVGVMSVFDVWCGTITFSSNYDDEKLTIKGNLTICMLIRDAEGNVTYTERQIDFEYEHQRDEVLSQASCEATVRATAADYHIINAQSLDVKIELMIEGTVSSVENLTIISDIIPDENEKKSRNHPALIIYYAESGESVWQIARKYNTTVSAITQENELNDDIIEDSRMILIPVVMKG